MLLGQGFLRVRTFWYPHSIQPHLVDTPLMSTHPLTKSGCCSLKRGKQVSNPSDQLSCPSEWQLTAKRDKMLAPMPIPKHKIPFSLHSDQARSECMLEMWRELEWNLLEVVDHVHDGIGQLFTSRVGIAFQVQREHNEKLDKQFWHEIRSLLGWQWSSAFFLAWSVDVVDAERVHEGLVVRKVEEPVELDGR